MNVCLCNDIINKILLFIFDIRGYNIFEINKNKKNNKYKMIRIMTELKLWKFYGVSINWLRPTKSQSKNNKFFLENLKKGKPIVTYNKGFYKNLEDEIRILKNNNIIP